ncbi:DVUA0089 family protein [Chondromyces apiculatus]|uniref:DVUA0089 family protein n=1 Tax=Chondromyces apiculatus TaxID=51 RepID=UPI000695026E|nr:DVUA0089 family protein [Chondromyces apiculatus]
MTCGDGVVGAGETCDDGNVTAGDGCDAACTVEAGYGCSGAPSVCATVCGDGIVAGAEACDDGNQVNFDGCSATCQVDAFTESEPNGTPGEADGPFSPEVLVSGAITPASDVDWYVFEVPEAADLRIATFDASGPSSCLNIDTTVALFAGDGTTQLAADDDGGPGACSLISGAAARVEAGTYYVRVGSAGLTIQGYTLTVSYDALCGDGVVEGGEQCDGTPGCDESCRRIPTCGDGFIDPPETCDDGNTTPGDGCDASCQLQQLTETEPNNTDAQANGPYAPVVLLGGAITPVGDVDYYAITLTATSDLRIATFDGTGPDACALGVDTVVTLLGSDGTTALISRDTGGVNACGAINASVPGDEAARHLAAGTYYVKVEDYLNNGTIAGYTLLVEQLARCGDGVVSGAEECDGGPGCTATCDRVAVCGDGFVDAPETCDDGNTTPGDGCNASCALELSLEQEPNGTASTANGPFMPYALLQGSINPANDVDYYAFTLTATSDVHIETFDGNGPGSCAGIDTYAFVLGTDQQTVIASADDGGIGKCSRVDPALNAGVRHLPAGTYYVDIEDRGNNTVIPTYRVEIKLTARCGDGVVEGSEECDGGASCTATCDRVAVCGDGYVDAPETCDDGNVDNDDGCSSVCAFETTPEIEPNNTTSEALDNLVHVNQTGLVSASIGAVGDVDVFAMFVPGQDRMMRIETFDATGQGCAGIATTIRILDMGGTQLYSDDNSGVGSCSALMVYLPEGIYYLQVEEYGNNAAIAAYTVQAREVTDGGTETEVNDLLSAADGLIGSDIYVLGGHLDSEDSDYFQIDMPAGKSLRAEIVEGGAETCESGGIDSYLVLYDATGQEVGFDDDGGREFCSRIDGIGTPATDSYASHLSGTYYLQVLASPFAQDPSDPNGQFDYRLAVTIR